MLCSTEFVICLLNMTIGMYADDDDESSVDNDDDVSTDDDPELHKMDSDVGALLTV